MCVTLWFCMFISLCVNVYFELCAISLLCCGYGDREDRMGPVPSHCGFFESLYSCFVLLLKYLRW